jgi:type I restriction enzyme, S subunit
MRYSPYPEYKNSDSQWIGIIPKHWDTIALKRKFRLVNGSTPKSGIIEYWDGDILWITPADFSAAINGRISTSARKITHEGLDSCGTSIVPADSIVITTRAPIGEVVQADKELCTNQGCKTLVLDASDVRERFIFYLIKASNDQLNALGLGSTFMELSKEALGYYKATLPPISEQKQIADFLDYKTAQIDALIAKKKELIEKLKEQRIAVITQAVTKGLDPDAPMRDSGVDWLGQVPEHWKVIPIKFSLLIPITDGPHETPELFDNGIPFISAEAVKGDKLDFEKKRGYISQEDHHRYSRKYKPLRGDVYMVKSGATTGNVARVETDEEFNIWSPLAAFRPSPETATTDFIFYFMKSKPFFHSVELSWSYGTQQNIGMGVIANLKMACPPVEEQKEITKEITARTQKIDGMINASQSAIDRLTEYRTALITATTTGKIDVRNVKLGKAR